MFHFAGSPWVSICVSYSYQFSKVAWNTCRSFKFCKIFEYWFIPHIVLIVFSFTLQFKNRRKKLSDYLTDFIYSIDYKVKLTRERQRKTHLDDPGEIPLDVQRFAMRKLDGTVQTEHFIFNTSQHLICAIPSELKRLINTNWYFDATFKACNAMIGYYQTLIITIKHEVGERVFLYPVTLILMKRKTTDAYVSALEDLQKINALL